MRIMIAAGGTGGHVYPALAVAESISAETAAIEMVFVGTVGGFERPLVDEAVADAGLKFTAYNEVRAGPLHGVNPLKFVASLGQLFIGAFQSLRLMAKHRPASLLLTGGWVNVPVALAAWLWRVPMLIFLPDIEPGLTIQVLRPLVKRVAVTTEESKMYIPQHQMVVTGYPLRRNVIEAVAKRDEALQHFQLDPARKTLLVFGGSRGARSINIAVGEIIPTLLRDGVQIIHATGTLDWERAESQKKALGDPADYHAFPYLHEDMGLAMAAADLVLCRSGASVLGELPLFGLPSILVPYPYAWRYQKVNADYLAARGAAILMEDAKMADELLPTIQTLFHDSARLATMNANVLLLARADGARRVADELLQLAGVKR